MAWEGGKVELAVGDSERGVPDGKRQSGGGAAGGRALMGGRVSADGRAGDGDQPGGTPPGDSRGRTRRGRGLEEKGGSCLPFQETRDIRSATGSVPK